MSIYEIRVQGRLDPHWVAWFEGMTLTYDGDCTLLRGPLADEAALHGVLANVRNLHARLLSVNTVKENSLSKTFVLIHGSWQGGWVWQAVIRQLEEKGHRAYAPTLAGHGPGAERVGITHKDCVDSVVAYIRQHDLHEIVLVGHSFGGSVISRVVEYLPDRIVRLIFMDAFVLEDGQSVYDNLPGPFIEMLDQLVHASADNTTLLPWEAWRDYFIQDATEEAARPLWEQLSPEPNQPNVERLDLTTFYARDIPKSYLFCRQDLTMPPGWFHPRMSSRLGTYKLVEMDGSHEVMFTRPVEVADKLIKASSD